MTDDKKGDMDELFEIDNMLDDLDDIEASVDGDETRRKKRQKRAKSTPKGEQKEEKGATKKGGSEKEEDKEYEEDYDEELTEEAKDDEKEVKKEEKKKEGEKEQGEKKECDTCEENAGKFVKDEVCMLAPSEKRDECVADFLEMMKRLRDGKMTMHDFEKEVKRLGRKYIKDWTDDDDKKEVIPEDAVKSALGKD